MFREEIAEVSKFQSTVDKLFRNHCLLNCVWVLYMDAAVRNYLKWFKKPRHLIILWVTPRHVILQRHPGLLRSEVEAIRQLREAQLASDGITRNLDSIRLIQLPSIFQIARENPVESNLSGPPPPIAERLQCSALDSYSPSSQPKESMTMIAHQTIFDSQRRSRGKLCAILCDEAARAALGSLEPNSDPGWRV